jgi:hypothetical protein
MLLFQCPNIALLEFHTKTGQNDFYGSWFLDLCDSLDRHQDFLNGQDFLSVQNDLSGQVFSIVPGFFKWSRFSNGYDFLSGYCHMKRIFLKVRTFFRNRDFHNVASISLVVRLPKWP